MNTKMILQQLTLSILFIIGGCGGGGSEQPTTAAMDSASIEAIGSIAPATQAPNTTSTSNTSDSMDTTTSTATTENAAEIPATAIPGTDETGYQALYEQPPASLTILFVGNSYMAYNPTIDNQDSRFGSYNQIVSLLKQAGIEVKPTLRSIGGGTLEQHWELGTGADTPRGLIDSGEFDLLIMQGRYDIHESDEKATRFNTYADKFATLAKQNNMNALLFGLWATDYQISPEEDVFGPVAHEVYRAAAERNSISYAPNGMAYTALYGQLANVLTEEKIENAMTADEVHPTAALAYLAANVVYRTLFATQSPALDAYQPPGVSTEIGNLMRTVAQEAVVDHGFTWK